MRDPWAEIATASRKVTRGGVNQRKIVLMHPVQIPYRRALFSGANLQASFNTDFATAFESSNVENAARMLTRANAADWIDLGAWVASPPLIARKVQFVHEAIKSMPRE